MNCCISTNSWGVKSAVEAKIASMLKELISFDKAIITSSDLKGQDW